MNKRLKEFITIFITLIIVLGLSTSISFGISDVTIKDYNTIPTLTQGQSYSIHGLIESKKKMNRVEIGVVNASTNKWVIHYDKKINTDNYSILKADTSIKFGTLKVGTYKYRIYAHSNGKVYTLLNQSFIVKAKPAPVPPKPTDLKTVSEQQTFLNRVNKGDIHGDLIVDGERGARTIASIKIFQQIEGLTVDGVWGKATEAASNKTIVVTKKRMAVNWACSVANDNSFAYGTGQRAHRSGCYVCQTNTGSRMKKKERKGEPHYVDGGHTYEKTYCCNTFITAAYAHGAGDATIYKICHRGSCCGMSPKEWEKSPYFKRIGKTNQVPYSQLQMGDVLMSDAPSKGYATHVWMHIGHGRFVEASNGSWKSISIAVKDGAKSKYKLYSSDKGYIVRYSK